MVLCSKVNMNFNGKLLVHFCTDVVRTMSFPDQL